MENDYVLCHWRGRRWPAKVLPRTLPTSPQRKRKWAHFLKLQILSVGDMISVRKTDVESLNESHIEPITAMLANQAQSSILREEDLAWHRAFTSALDILKERDASKATRAPDAPEDGQHLEPQTTKGTSEQAAPHYTVKGAAGLYAYIPPGVRLRPLSVRLQRDPALDSLTSQVPPPTVCTPRRQQTFSPQQVRLCTNDPPHSERTQTVRKKKRGLFRVLTLRHKVMKAAGVYGNLPPGITLRSLSVRLQHDPALDRHALYEPQAAVLISKKKQASAPQQMGVGGNHTRHSRYKDQAMCDRDRAPSSTLSLSHRVQQIAGLYADLPPGVSLRPLSVRLQHDPALGRLALQVPPPTVYMPRRQQTFSPQQARLCTKDPAHSERAQTVHKKKTGLFRDLSLRHKFKKAAGVHRRLPSGITFSSPSVRLQHDPTLDRRVSQLRSTISTTQLPSQEVCPDLLSLPADEQQQTPKSKRGPPDFTASHHTAKENNSGDSAALPPAFIDTVAPALVRDVQDSRPAAQPLPWERAPPAESAEDPGEGTSSSTSSVPVWQGASKASSSTAHPRVPSLASRRGKQQAPSSQAAPQEPCSSSHSQTTHTSAAAKGDGGQEAGEPTGVAFPRNPPTIQRGSLVWMKFQHHPYWPAVVKSMCKTEKTARVLLIEACMPTERRGIQVPLRKLKHLDCREKETLVKRASKQYQHAVKWCLALVAQYTEARAHRSFRGSFLTFYSTDASSSTRKAIKDCDGPISFPEVNYADLEDWEEEDRWLGGMSRCKKILPDRMKAAWNRENQKLVDFIVKRKGADPHLLDIVHGRKYSQWLASFLKSARYMICVETYLEDEDQLEAVVKHLQTVYKEMGQRMKRAIRNDPVSFVLEVLLPEAIICAISALYGLEYNDAETKYLEGPPVHTREKELFDRKILKQVRKKAARASIAN